MRRRCRGGCTGGRCLFAAEAADAINMSAAAIQVRLSRHITLAHDYGGPSLAHFLRNAHGVYALVGHLAFLRLWIVQDVDSHVQFLDVQAES